MNRLRIGIWIVFWLIVGFGLGRFDVVGQIIDWIKEQY